MRAVLSDDQIPQGDFPSEKALSQFIEENIEDFCDHLGLTYISHKADHDLRLVNRFGPRGRRPDFVIETEYETVVVELKNGSGPQVRAGIGQLLDYGREFLDTKKECVMVLVSSRFDSCAAKTIEAYHLPIRYVVMSHEKTAEFVGHA